MKRLASVVACACLVACSQKRPEPEPPPKAVTSVSTSPAPTPSGSSSSAATKSGKPLKVSWDAPASFERQPDKPMRDATYKIKRAPGDSEDGELAVSQVGGTLEANIKRWSTQFDDKTTTKRTERTVGEIKVTIVELTGTYSGMQMPGQPPSQPKSNYALLGAIIDTEVPTFFKLVGPAKTVGAARVDFDRMVDSIHPK